MKGKNYWLFNWKTIIIMLLFFSFALIIPNEVSALSCRLTKVYDKENLSEEELKELEKHDASEDNGPCKYKDFDWEKFYFDQKKFWGSDCADLDVDSDAYAKCESPILKEQEKFFTKMYQALANYQDNPGNPLVINDVVILRTLFFEMLPNDLTEQVDTTIYDEYYHTGKLGGKYDESASISPDDPFTESEAKYYENELDTLKIIIKNAVAYTSMCYISYGEAVHYEGEDGESRPECVGSNVVELSNGRMICGEKEKKHMMGFWEYFVSRLRAIVTRIIPFLGWFWPDAAQDSCEAISGKDSIGEYRGVYDFNDDPEVNYAKYFEFLESNRFFDRKAHLQHYFEDTVLYPNGFDCMTSDVCENSLDTNENLYKELEPKNVAVRKSIVENIKSLLEMDGIYIDAEGYIYDPDKYGDGSDEPGSGRLGSSDACGDNLVWPIGSKETTVSDGVEFAMGSPMSTKITSHFGARTAPVPGASTNHGALDIGAAGYGSGVIPVIAAADGVVSSTFTGCTTDSHSGSPSSSLSCGGRLGNSVTIEHSNGLITKYGHLAYNSIVVTPGQRVYRGQVIAKVGSTGGSTGPHLHFVVKSGGVAVDPENYVSPDTPRPECTDGEGFSANSSSLTKEEFISSVTTYCSSHNCPDTIVNGLGEIYDFGQRVSLNPELIIVIGVQEGWSPQSGNNYWGLGCTNSSKNNTGCLNFKNLYSALNELKNTIGSASSSWGVYNNGYSYLGDYWYGKNIKYASGYGGCYYLDSIRSYLSDSTHADEACGANNNCDYPKKGNCVETNDDEKKAYKSWKADQAEDLRKAIFGLGDN